MSKQRLLAIAITDLQVVFFGIYQQTICFLSLRIMACANYSCGQPFYVADTGSLQCNSLLDRIWNLPDRQYNNKRPYRAGWPTW